MNTNLNLTKSPFTTSVTNRTASKAQNLVNMAESTGQISPAQLAPSQNGTNVLFDQTVPASSTRSFTSQNSGNSQTLPSRFSQNKGSTPPQLQSSQQSGTGTQSLLNRLSQSRSNVYPTANKSFSQGPFQGSFAQNSSPIQGSTPVQGSPVSQSSSSFSRGPFQGSFAQNSSPIQGSTPVQSPSPSQTLPVTSRRSIADVISQSRSSKSSSQSILPTQSNNVASQKTSLQSMLAKSKSANSPSSTPSTQKTSISSMLAKSRESKYINRFANQPLEEKISSISLNNPESFAENDKFTPVSVTPLVKNSSGDPLEDYKRSLRSLKITVTDQITFDDSPNMLLLSAVTDKDIKFYVLISTFNHDSVYLPESHISITKFEGSKFHLEDSISLSDCKELATCDLLYNCNDEFCMLKKEGHGLSKINFVITKQGSINSSLSIEGSVVSKPVVTYEELIGNPTETLASIEQTFTNLLTRNVENTSLNATANLKKLGMASFDSVSVNNLFKTVFVQLETDGNSLSVELDALKLQPLTPEVELKMNETADKLGKINSTSEKVLASMQKFNKTTEIAVDAVNQTLSSTVSQMESILDSYLPEGSELRSSEFKERLLQGDRLISSVGTNPLDINLLIE